MPITSNSLFHFTISLDSLLGILRDKFRITYCLEKYTLADETHEYAYPMISFCDIPLSLAKDHINKYGSYGIGLTKVWGIRQGLNPVVYMSEASHLAADVQLTLRKLIDIISAMSKAAENATKMYANTKPAFDNSEIKTADMKRLGELQAQTEETLRRIKEISAAVKPFEVANSMLQEVGITAVSVFRYIKNYQGTLLRKNGTRSNYRFYDEREWRYLPLQTEPVKDFLDPDEYNVFRGNGETKPFIDGQRLTFATADIKYLIVESETDVLKIIQGITANQDLGNEEQKAFLTTKILTVAQLNEDF